MKTIITLICILLFITGCANKPKSICPSSAQLHVMRSYIAQMPQKNGDRLVLTAQTHRLFNNSSANISSSGANTLDKFAALFRCYETVDVKVTTYLCTNIKSDPYTTPALTKARSTAIINYLWRKNIDARLGVGEGIVTKTCQKSDTSKVEISAELWKNRS